MQEQKGYYRAVILVHYSELVDETRDDEYVEFDYIDDKTVSSDANITSSPTVEGDFIADHMYRNPKSVSLPGKFSLIGNKGTNFVEDKNRLVAIEKKFEDIQARGIKCSIITRRENSTDVQFITRENMYLKSISWTERVNSVDFNFGFEEAITVTTDTVDYDTNVVDDTLPNLTEPVNTSAFGQIIDLTSLENLIDKMALDTGLVEPDFMELFWVRTGAVVGTIVGGVMVGVGMALGIGALSFAVLSNPVGWIIGGIAAVVGTFIAVGSYVSNNEEKKKYAVEQFRLYDDDKQNLAEIDRYQAFKSQIIQQIQQISEAMSVYQLSTDEDQQCMLAIDDEYWTFSFVRDNDTQLYKLTATSETFGREIQMSSLSTMTNICQLTEDNAFFTTTYHGWYVYIMCPEIANVNLTKDDNEEMLKDLRNYSIVITKFNPEKFTEMVTDIVKNAILK